MLNLRERIQRGKEKIAEAIVRGKDTSTWEAHLEKLKWERFVELLESQRERQTQEGFDLVEEHIGKYGAVSYFRRRGDVQSEQLEANGESHSQKAKSHKKS